MMNLMSENESARANMTMLTNARITRDKTFVVFAIALANKLLSFDCFLWTNCGRVRRRRQHQYIFYLISFAFTWLWYE